MLRRLRTSLALVLTITIPGSALASGATPVSLTVMRVQTSVLEPTKVDVKTKTAKSRPPAPPVADAPATEVKAPRERKPYPQIEHQDPESLTEEQRTARARTLYIEAEAFADKGEWEEAIVRYEEAYRMVPAKHGFAYKVGVAAKEIGDCSLAKEYLQHLLNYGADQEKLAEKVADSKRILDDIDISGCAEEEPAASVVEENPLDSPMSSPRDDLAADGRDGKRGRSNLSPKALGGWALSGVGILALGAGVGTLIAASKKGKELEGLSGDGGLYPQGDYSCRDDDAPCPYVLEKRLKGLNMATSISLSVGAAALGTGIVLLILDKKNASAGEKPSTTAVAPMWLPGGAGATATLRF